MTGGVVDAISAVLRKHRTHADWWIGGGRARCSCGWVAAEHHFDGTSTDVVEQEKANHAASAVQAALELREMADVVADVIRLWAKQSLRVCRNVSTSRSTMASAFAAAWSKAAKWSGEIQSVVIGSSAVGRVQRGNPMTTTEREFVVKCLDCPRSETPLLWRMGTCLSCAETSVTKHLLEYPLHRCEVIGNEAS